VAALTCRELVELVTDYLEGALDEDTARRFEEHLAVCPGCRTYVDQVRETVSRAGEVPVADLTAEARTVLLTAFRDFRR
jgi:predicted anti-sigma-YlaC factor YlaD